MTAPINVLITGFGPFPGAPVNPTGPLARALAVRRRAALAPLQRRAEVLTTSWAALDTFGARLDRHDPDVVLMLGLAARRREVCVETVAVNAARSYPDAERRRFPGLYLRTGGAGRVRSAADAAPLVHALRSAGLPARASRDAGRYLCNALAFAVYERAASTRRPRRAVFVHVPLGLDPSDLLRGLETVLVALVAQLRAAPSR